MSVTMDGITVEEKPRGLHMTTEREDGLDWVRETPYAIVELLEGFRANGHFEEVLPEKVGALTDSVLFAHRIVRGEDHEIVDVGDVFWFPGYQLRDPAVTLLEDGEIIFERDPEGKTRHVRMQEIVNVVNAHTGREIRLDYRMRGFPVRLMEGDTVVQEFEDDVHENIHGVAVDADLNAERRLLDWMEGWVAGMDPNVEQLQREAVERQVAR